MTELPEGNAIIYCEGGYETPNGKTAHGLVRRTNRYYVMSVIDKRCSGKDAGTLLDGKFRDIPICENIEDAIKASNEKGHHATHMVIGLAPDGGRLNINVRKDILEAVDRGLNVDSGLHDFLSEDREIMELAKRGNVKIRDVRKPPHKDNLHFFSGKIEEVSSKKLAVLGTDSAIGKRTTSWILLDALTSEGISSELIGTGQTAWMQGVRYGVIMDSLINDFVSGEIEHAVWSAWKEIQPRVIIIEGQGSLMNPAYPGGFEILAAGRPDAIILQHAPARKEYDGFPGYEIQPLEEQINAIQLISGKPVIAITINHENLNEKEILETCRKIKEETGLPVHDVLTEGGTDLVKSLISFFHDFGNKKDS